MNLLGSDYERIPRLASTNLRGDYRCGKTVTLQCDGQNWRVGYGLLHRLIDADSSTGSITPAADRSNTNVSSPAAYRRRIVDRGHRDRYFGQTGTIQVVVGAVGEAVRADVAAGGGVAEGAVAVMSQPAVFGAVDQHTSQGGAVHVGVVVTSPHFQ
jgi:hypothetical protein